jgi:hypothetical protein
MICIVLCIDPDAASLVTVGHIYVCTKEVRVGMEAGMRIICDDGMEHSLYKRRFKIVIEP